MAKMIMEMKMVKKIIWKKQKGNLKIYKVKKVKNKNYTKRMKMSGKRESLWITPRRIWRRRVHL